jgi:hypothetical protein
MSDHGRWNERTRALLHDEARHEAIPAAARHRIERRLQASVVASAVASGAFTAARAGAARGITAWASQQTTALLIAVAGGGAAGGAFVYGVDHLRAPPEATAPRTVNHAVAAAPPAPRPVTVATAPPKEPARSEAAPSVSRPPPVWGAPVDPAGPSRRSLPAPREVVPVPPGVLPASGADRAASAPVEVDPYAGRDLGLAAERHELELARGHIAAGDYAQALAAAERHRARFPDGRLAQEREALAIQALVGARRYDDARRRAQSFHAQYPKSILAVAVDAALLAIP